MSTPLHARIAAKVVEAEDICRFELVDVQGRALPSFTAGAHIDVALPGGAVRQYSLCNDPAERHRYELGVLRVADGRGGSQAMHGLEVGALVHISAPRNHFPLVAGAGRSLLVGGGIGITPLLAMAAQLDREGADFRLHYCTRSAARTAFGARLATGPFASRVQLHHDDGPAVQRLDIAALLRACEDETQLYVCGPAGFMDAVLSAARAEGWPQTRLHVEYFAAPAGADGDDRAFDVVLARSGRVVPVPADRSVVQALADAGVALPVSCEQGVCGTCLTRVIDGEVLHRDLYLTPDEQAAHDRFTPCCSRARSARLVLDL